LVELSEKYVKKVREAYISPYCRLALVPLNSMKFDIRGHLTDIIVCQIFSQSIQGLQSFDTLKIAISHRLAASPLSCDTVMKVVTPTTSHVKNKLASGTQTSSSVDGAAAAVCSGSIS